MGKFILEKHSKPVTGKEFCKENLDRGLNIVSFHIYRYDPECDSYPRIDVFHLNYSQCGNMVLDALLYIKNYVDPSLTFRRSCREGVCGSCAMNINGVNTLACIKKLDLVHDSRLCSETSNGGVAQSVVGDNLDAERSLKAEDAAAEKNSDVKYAAKEHCSEQNLAEDAYLKVNSNGGLDQVQDSSIALNVSHGLGGVLAKHRSNLVVKIYPLPHMKVIKDLVPDLNKFYNQIAEVKPWLQSKEDSLKGVNKPREAMRERIQLPHQLEELNNASDCILCACCSTSCPSYWWNGEEFLGPAALLAAYRWIVDSRDDAEKERMQYLSEGVQRLYRCHSIMNCTSTCPKGLNPSRAISKIKEKLSNAC